MKNRSPKLLIFLTIFIDLLGFGIIIPILSYISDNYAHGSSRAVVIGGLMATYSLFQMIFSPIWGRLSDRVGRRPILLLSLFGSATSYLIFALSQNLPMLFVSRIFGGICAANLTAAQAYIADITPPEERTRGMGLIGMAFGMGFAFGPVLGAAASNFGIARFPDLPHQTLPGLLAAAICFINLGWAYKSLPESLPPEKRAQVDPALSQRLAPLREVGRNLAHPLIGPLVAVFFLATFAFSNMEMALGIFAKKTPGLTLTEPQIYYLFIYIGLLLAIMNGMTRQLVKRIPETSLVIFGTAAQAVSFVIIPAWPTVSGMLVAMAVLAVGQGLCVPSLLGLVSKATGAERQGQVLGVTQSASSLARILGPVVGGIAIAIGERTLREPDRIAALGWPFYVGAVIMLAAVAMSIVTRRRLDAARPAR